jgi:hypothetical protein
MEIFIVGTYSVTIKNLCLVIICDNTSWYILHIHMLMKESAGNFCNVV